MIEETDEFPDICYEEILKETDLSYLFDIDGDGNRKIWLPKSQVEDLDEKEKTFNIPRWLAEKNELI